MKIKFIKKKIRTKTKEQKKIKETEHVLGFKFQQSKTDKILCPYLLNDLVFEIISKYTSRRRDLEILILILILTVLVAVIVTLIVIEVVILFGRRRWNLLIWGSDGNEIKRIMRRIVRGGASGGSGGIHVALHLGDRERGRKKVLIKKEEKSKPPALSFSFLSPALTCFFCPVPLIMETKIVKGVLVKTFFVIINI